jgi:hypothetical protein
MKFFVNKKIRFKKSDITKTWYYLLEQVQGGIFEPTSWPFWHPFVAKLRAFAVSRTHQKSDAFSTLEDLRALKGKKLLFPLHVTPEASTDTWAPKFNNMLETAQNLIQNLPAGWTLAMKEHPSSIYLQRNQGELKALRALPRSIFLSPLISNNELVPECNMSLVVNGTFGLEMMTKGLPVVTLGNPFYDLSGNTLPCPDVKNLSRVLMQAENFHADQQKSERFIARYYDCTHPGDPSNPELFGGVITQENTRRIADGFQQRFLQKREACV